MTELIKCPKCGSEKTLTHDDKLEAIYSYCEDCDCIWTVWQQSLIDSQREEIFRFKSEAKSALELIAMLRKNLSIEGGMKCDRYDYLVAENTRLLGLLKEIEGHAHLDPMRIPSSTKAGWMPISHCEGHRCCAEIAKRAKGE